MDDSDTLMSTLLCQEDESCLNENNYKDVNLGLCSISECDEEYIQMLIQREAICQTDSNLSLGDCSFSRVKKAGLNAPDGKLWAFRLLSVACLSLAAKMEECQVPALSEFHVDDYNFEGNVIQKMELLILKTLEWKMSSITPFSYLHYFTTKFCGECSHKELVTRAVELIFAVIKEINVVENRPSIIAAAALLSAYDYQLTKKVLEIKMNTISSWGSLEKENIFSCYSLLQEIGIQESKTPTSVVTQNLMSTHSSSTDVLENSSISTASSKRSLTYPDCD
ncbi:Cyclin-D5-1 [Forsythia ovata]|uniref:Cyclin-D5-1 n=1 Tax=Forsythia ovata TaxID=205694 RepID=A0ABD1UTS6_9LAMI